MKATTDNTLPSFRIGAIRGNSEGFPKSMRMDLRDIQDDGEIKLVEVDYGDGNQTVFYKWEIDTMHNSIYHYYLKEGAYNITVSMIDNEGASTTKSKTLNLKDNKLPVLKYSVNSTSGVAPFTLRVDAGASFDPDNDNPLHFYWGWGEDNASRYTSDTVSTHTYTQPGIYQVSVYVRDERYAENGGGAENSNNFTVYVDDPNNLGTYSAPAGGSPPVINLKGMRDSFGGKAPLTVEFDASESFDLEGDSFDVFWEFSNVTFRKYEKGLKVTKTFDNPGYHFVDVGVRDSHGNEHVKTFDILVYDPEVKEQPRFFIRQDDNNPYYFHFSADVAHLYGVPAAEFFWDLGNGDMIRGLYDYTYSQNGIYPVTLSTIDMFGNRQSVSKILTVDGKQHKIEVEVAPYYQETQVGSSFSLIAELPLSFTAVLDFFWNMVTGVREKDSIDYSYSKKGIYRTEMRATNRQGISLRKGNLTAVSSGQGPSAYAKLSTYIGSAPLIVNFDGSHSKSPARITDYDWHIADYQDVDKAFHTATASYTFKKPGDRYPNLHVKDSNGNFGANFYKVTVLDPDDVDSNNQSPTVRINTNEIQVNDLEVDMAATFSDSDGNIRYTEWDWGDGVIDVFRYHEDSPYHRYEDYGSHTITVRVFDNMGAITTATHNITLKKPQNAPPQSLRSAPIARGQEQTQRVLPAQQFNNRNLFEEERYKSGCHKKEDGQIRCYAPRINRRGI